MSTCKTPPRVPNSRPPSHAPSSETRERAGFSCLYCGAFRVTQTRAERVHPLPEERAGPLLPLRQRLPLSRPHAGFLRTGRKRVDFSAERPKRRARRGGSLPGHRHRAAAPAGSRNPPPPPQGRAAGRAGGKAPRRYPVRRRPGGPSAPRAVREPEPRTPGAPARADVTTAAPLTAATARALLRPAERGH